MTAEDDLHPDIAYLSFLLGTWRGSGSGSYPTVRPFEYEEDLTFSHVGKPYLVFQQRTWVLREGVRVPSHMELAFWRAGPEGAIEVVSTHPNGVIEIEVGRAEGDRISLASTTLVPSPSAKDITRLERAFTVTEDLLVYDVSMAAMGQPLVPHLHAELRRLAATA